MTKKNEYNPSLQVYEHLQNNCKTRFSADFLNEKLDEYLKSLTIPSEVSELYIVVWSVKTKNRNI